MYESFGRACLIFNVEHGCSRLLRNVDLSTKLYGLTFQNKHHVAFFKPMRDKQLKLSLCPRKDHVINAYGGVKAQIHVFISLDGGEEITPRPSCFTPG
jgi:hypothetical protein